MAERLNYAGAAGKAKTSSANQTSQFKQGAGKQIGSAGANRKVLAGTTTTANNRGGGGAVDDNQKGASKTSGSTNKPRVGNAQQKGDTAAAATSAGLIEGGLQPPSLLTAKQGSVQLQSTVRGLKDSYVAIE